jgi:hypothetical protein
VIQKTGEATEITRSFIDVLAAAIHAAAIPTGMVVPVSETSAGEGGLTRELPSTAPIPTRKPWYHQIMVKHKGLTAQLMLD